MKSALFRLIYWLTRFLRPRIPQGSPETFLILQYQMPLGCCVHGTPLYAALKSMHMHASVIVASRGLGAAVIQHDPNVDHLVTTGDPNPSFGAKWQVAGELRAELRKRNLKPTLVLQDASSKAGSFALLPALLRLAPSKGFANAPELYDTHLAYDLSQSLIDNNLRLADSQHQEPAVYFTAAELSAARTLLAEANPQQEPLTAFVMQGSGGQRTGWHDDRMASVIRDVESQGFATVFLGTSADTPVIDRIRTLAGSSGASLAGRTSVPELAAVLALSDYLITLDTGTMHVGRAVDVPMVVLGPSWQRPLEWLPLTKPNARILRGADTNIPLDQVPMDYRLDEIEVPAVLAAFSELQAAYPPSTEAREARVASRLSTTRA